MATYQAPPAKPPRPSHYPQSSVAMAQTNVPPGTFAPGTKVQVGSHRAIVEKYLSEGGFAHVYVVQLPGPNASTAVLKRVAVPDKETLGNMRTEVETMKKLKGHKHIVTYMDSHASQLKGGGYEVFLLMEYCSGGGLIDFMNTRLQNRLKEPEILEIFSDAAEGVACMHYLKPPLLHRDLKVENILISKAPSGQRIYKLCDFGSTAPPRPAATTAAEGRLIDDDVQKHTTLQYRSPEMIDVYRKRPIDEKSDIWALGVLLYKLCYYTTPFEEQGQMAILTAKFRYPGYPPFSDRLKKLIATMLTEDPQRRPNIFEVVKEVSSMRGKPCPIPDIYARRTHSEVRNNQRLPPREPNEPNVPSQPIGASLAPPEMPTQYIPEVTPMRRGRPTSQGQQKRVSGVSPSPAGIDVDPFAALDSTNHSTRAAAVDKLSSRFPSVDEFSILHNKSGKFEFDEDASKTESLNQRVTNALADEAFAKSPPQEQTAKRTDIPDTVPQANSKIALRESGPFRDSSRQRSVVPQPEPKPATMVSTGTMTSRPSSPEPQPQPQPRARSPPKFDRPSVDKRPIWRIPDQSDNPRYSSIAKFDSVSSKYPELRRHSPSPSPQVEHGRPRSPASSRPSLEGNRPLLDVPDSLHRSKSANAGSQGHSREKTIASLHPPRLDSLYRHGSGRRRKAVDDEPGVDTTTHLDEPNIESNVDYLRAIEEQDAAKSHHRRSSSIKHIKHTSMPSMSLSGTKNILAGKFGDTFRRFEGRHSPKTNNNNMEMYLGGEAAEKDQPLAGLADSKAEDLDTDAVDETEDLPPEVRREIERRRLSQEERRVADAAAAYRERLATQGDVTSAPKSSKAIAIQERVKSLLDESEKPSPVKKSAEGYGRFTGITEEGEGGATLPQRPPPNKLQEQRPSFDAGAANPAFPAVTKRPVAVPSSNPLDPSVPVSALPKPPYQTRLATAPSGPRPLKPSPTVVTTATMQKPPPSRPSAPPKPVALRTGGGPTSARYPLTPPMDAAAEIKHSHTVPPEKKTAESTPIREGNGDPDAGVDTDTDWEERFARKYPSLSLEMVETEITGRARAGRQRMREIARRDEQGDDHYDDDDDDDDDDGRNGGEEEVVGPGMSSVGVGRVRPGVRVRDV